MFILCVKIIYSVITVPCSACTCSTICTSCVTHLQVLSFILLIYASVVMGELNDIADIEYDNSGRYRAAAGWLIFVAVTGMLIQTAIIFVRFLNITFINQNFIIFGFIVSQLCYYNIVTKECNLFNCIAKCMCPVAAKGAWGLVGLSPSIFTHRKAKYDIV